MSRSSVGGNRDMLFIQYVGVCMKEASFQDAVMIGQLLNVNKDEVWKIVKGVRFNTLSELSLLVHTAFKGEAPPEAPKGLAP